MIVWIQNCSKIDTLKDKKWCRFVYVQIIVWMMLSIVMRNVWIDWFRNYERQNVNLCTVIANQLPDHHSFNMKWRQNLCQKSCQNIWSKFISSNLILCHNNDKVIIERIMNDYHSIALNLVVLVNYMQMRTQKVCECQNTSLNKNALVLLSSNYINWILIATHLRKLYFQHFFTAIVCVICSVF